MGQFTDKGDLPLQRNSERGISEKADLAISYLLRKDALDLVEILGLKEAAVGNSALIPVYLNWDTGNVVAQAYLDSDGNISFKVPASSFTEEVENLVTVNQIKYLSIGIGYLGPNAEIMNLNEEKNG